jgi:hypothetical protein
MNFFEEDIFFHSGYQGRVVKPVMTDGNDSATEPVFTGLYDVTWGPANLPMRFKEEWMEADPAPDAENFYGFEKVKRPNIIVCDDFYENPDHVRELALIQEFNPDLRYHKGERTKNKFLFPFVKERLEEIIGAKISGWTTQGYNGVFQFCKADTPIVYHSDIQSYAAVVYLTPNAPPEAGTSFFASKAVKGRRKPPRNEPNMTEEEARLIDGLMYGGKLLDKTAWELIDVVGNVYNRLAIWDSQLVHAASCYFGDKLTNCRLFHMYFFDIVQ